MTGIARYLAAATVLAILGVLCLGASRLDRRVADAQQLLLTSDYAAADESLSAVEPYYDYAAGVPWVGDGPVNAVRARRGAINYWRGEYAVLAPDDRTDPVADVPPTNVALQLIVADAAYRDGQARAKDRTTTLEVLESAINAYRTVLNNATHEADARYAKDAAYNFEYVVRLREEVLKGRRRALAAPDEDGGLGAEGKSEDAVFEREFKQYMPLEKDEREQPGAGQFDPPARKG
jgi:hypothetical protein